MISDILVLIAQHLRNDPVSLLRLCLADKTTYQLLRFVLYQDVQLVSATSVKSFCSAIMSNEGADAGKHVVSLSIGRAIPVFWVEDSSLCICKTLAPDLRAALRLMPNLKDLTLFLTSKALNMTLNALNPPFKLRRLVYSTSGSIPAIQFLVDQPSISELEMRGHISCGTSQNLQRILFQKPAHLPHLRTLLGPLNAVPVLASTRPVESIVLTDMWNARWEQPLEHIVVTSVPLRSVRFISFSEFDGFWSQALDRIKSRALLSSLTEILIEEHIPVSTRLNYATPPAEYIANRLLGFEVLETLEFRLITSSCSLEVTEIMGWLGHMGSLSSWIAIAPSLRRVVIFGIQLE